MDERSNRDLKDALARGQFSPQNGMGRNSPGGFTKSRGESAGEFDPVRVLDFVSRVRRMVSISFGTGRPTATQKLQNWQTDGNRAAHTAFQPPSTNRQLPVTNDASSEARKSTQFATSSGLPKRFRMVGLVSES